MKKLLTLFALMLLGTPLCADDYNFAPLKNWPPPAPKTVESGSNVVRPSLSGKGKKNKKPAPRRVNLAAIKKLKKKPVRKPVRTSQPIAKPQSAPAQPVVDPVVKPQVPQRVLTKKRKKPRRVAQSAGRHTRRRNARTS